MNIIAHKSKDGREQSLREHSQNVSRMAVSFAATFGGEKLAERIGLSHDAGKNTIGFQQYIRNPGKCAKSPHAVIGATLNGIAGDFPSAVIVEGHHSGLHNMCDTRSNLNAALAERGQDVVKAQEYFSTDAISQTAVFPEFARKNRVLGQFSFIKMEFSCLTDADYQDTERFMHGYSPRSYDYDSFSDIYDMFRKHIQPWIDKDNKMVKENDQPLTKDEEINHMRTQMMLQCLDTGSNSRKGDIRTLSIPTGGSKTLSSFAYAIAAAKKDKSIKRIMIENILKTPTTIEVVFDAKMSNPNGDPDNENAPRQNSEGFGYMTPECIKYKIRNVLNIMANFGEIDPDTNHLYCSPDTYSIESSIRECLGKKPSDFKKLTFEDELTMRKKLCDYFVDARWFGMVNTSYSSYNTLGKIEGAFQLSFPMSYDPIRIASISNTRCCVSSDDERKGNEKVPKNKDRTMGRFSVVEYGLYHMYIQTSTKAILRNGVTEDDLKLLIQTILHMFDDDMSSVRPSMTVRKVVVVRQNRNSGRVRPTDIEDAMVAKLKPGVNSPTSFNDYNLEFKRDMLPDSVEVKEYTMDNPDGIIL